jgi:hypothetical protein
VDYSFGLQFFEMEQETEFRINCPFSLGTVDAPSLHDPERSETMAEPIRLFRAEVTEARAYEDGTLDVLFADGRRLTVAPDPNYEAWQMTCADGMMFVALPGGGLAIWDAPGSGETK